MVIEKKQQIWMERRWKRTVNGKSRLVGEAGASWIDQRAEKKVWRKSRGSGRMWKAPFTWTKEKSLCQTRVSNSLFYFVGI
jgi:hypothetical protein